MRGGDDLPTWSCGYDCRANRGDDAWCYNAFREVGQRARCMDQLTEVGDLEMCWAQGMPAVDGDCEVECTTTPEHPTPCQTDWNYPSEYTCGDGSGAPICRIEL